MMFLSDTLPEVIVDMSEQLKELTVIRGELQYITGFCLFFVVVLLLYFTYKFFRMFF